MRKSKAPKAATKGRIARFDLPFYNGRHRLRVRIHPSLSSLQAAWRATGDGRASRGVRAFWACSRRWTIRVPSMAFAQKYLGAIHLCEGYVGSGVWAHELQHFISNWVAIKGWGIEAPHFERIAELVQELTRKFWAKYFELHPEYQPLLTRKER